MSDHITSLVSAITKFLGCPCTYFAPMVDDEPLMEAYRQALEESAELKTFVPVIIVPSDTLLDTLVMNSDETANGDDIPEKYDPEEVTSFRNELLVADSSLGAAALSELVSIAQDVLEDPELFERMINEEGGTVESHHQFLSYWDYDSGMTEHVILARIPVSHPYNVFAYLPMGGWNACPSNSALIAISRLWYENYGAIPAVISKDTVEYLVEEAVPESECKDLAIKQYAFCPSIIEESDGITISSHAESLKSSSVWYFWWD